MEDTAYPCLHFTKYHEEFKPNTTYPEDFYTPYPRLHPYQFTYPERRFTTEEMLYKFIEEEKREHEEMSAFIREFRTTNEVLFKERNNSLSELRLRKEKEEAQQRKFLENLKQLHTNFPFIEALAQMPKYAKFLKILLTNKARLEEAYTVTMNERSRGTQIYYNKLRTCNRFIQYPRGIIENVLIKVDKFVLPINFVILDMPEDSRILIIIGRSFLETTLAMIDVFNKKITLRVGDDEVIFNVDQSVKRPPAEDDECYGIDDLDETIKVETQELLGNNEFDLFLLMGLEKSINQSDLEICDSIGDKSGNDSDLGKPIRRIDAVNTPYSVAQTARSDGVESEHLYSASANKIDEKKPKLKDLLHHLEYAYLHCDKFFPIIILSKLFEKEKMLLLQVLEKHKGAFAWKMSDIKGIRLFQIPITPEDQEKMTFTCPYGTFAYRRMSFGLCNAPVTFQRCMTMIFHDMMEDFMEVFMEDFLVSSSSFNYGLANLDKMLARCEETNLVLNWGKCHFMIKECIVLGHKISGAGFDIKIKDNNGTKNLAADLLSRLENPDLGVFIKEEITNKFPDEHLMMLKEKPNDDESWYADYVNYIVEKIVPPRWTPKKRKRLRGDKDFKVGDKVLLYNSRLRMHPGKLKLKWYGPNVVKIVYPYGTVEITDKNRISFKVNGKRLKKYYDGHIDIEDKEMVEFNEDTT
nr:hypothetical protein [Tanacetum cinerariifolium]